MNAVPTPGSSRGFSTFFGKPFKPSQQSPRWKSAVGLGVGAVTLGLALMSRPELAPRRKAMADWMWESVQRNYNVSPFASMSLAANAQVQDVCLQVVEPKTGMTFPSTLDEERLLTGTGLRQKSILGLKKITVYAYGVYVDPASLKGELGDKYGNLDPEEVKKDEEFFKDLIEKDVGLSVRLVISYGRLKIGSVRSAFEESVGSRIKKFGDGSEGDLLKRFTCAFTDDIMLPRGTTIDLNRLPGSVLQTKIAGTEVGRVQSALLCRSLFDLYIGDDSFDKDAKVSIASSLAPLVSDQ